MVKRNDPCHCGSGIKYKRCCLPKDAEKNNERGRVMSPAEKAAWEATKHKVPTWLISVIAIVVFLVIGAILFFFELQQVAGAVVGCGLLATLMFAVFRSAPPVRESPGDGGNIQFGS